MTIKAGKGAGVASTFDYIGLSWSSYLCLVGQILLGS